MDKLSFCLYTFDLSSPTPEVLDRYHFSFGLLLSRPLLELSQLDVYPVRRVIHAQMRLITNQLQLSSDQLKSLKDFHQHLFMCGNVPRSKSLDEAKMAVELSSSPLWSGLLVPLSKNDRIDFVLVNRMSRCHPWTEFSGDDPESLIGRCVKRDYGRFKDTLEVVGVDSNVTALSEFPDKNKAPTYFAYFKATHGVTVRQPQLPLLLVQGVGVQWSFRQQVLSDDEESKRKASRIHIPSSLVLVFALSAGEFRAFGLLCTLLANLFHRQQVSQFASTLRRSLQSPRPSTKQAQRTTPKGLGSLTASKEGVFDFLFPPKEIIFRALSCKRAGYDENLERLEMLGDCFLKLSTSVFLFCRDDLHRAREGQLTMCRMKAISNAALYHVARCRGLCGFIMRQPLDIKRRWLPPSFNATGGIHSNIPTNNQDQTNKDSPDKDNSEKEEDDNSDALRKLGPRALTHQELPLKSISDVVESLIGAFLQVGGHQAARVFMVAMGIPHMIDSDALRHRSHGISTSTLPEINLSDVDVQDDDVARAFLCPRVPPSLADDARYV